jgi:hypothetical protein
MYKDKDPEIVMLEHMEKLLPLYCSDRYRRLFPSEFQAAKNHKLVMDTLPVLRLMAVYQSRYNVASLQVSTNQEKLDQRVNKGKVACWQAMNRLARLGLELNILETHISEGSPLVLLTLAFSSFPLANFVWSLVCSFYNAHHNSMEYEGRD